MTARSVYGLVLAGGKSRRMGKDKALLVNNGRSQLAHVAGILKGCLSQVFISTRADQADDPERSRFELIIDRYEDLGPVAGILTAMDEYPDVDWLVVACDLPNINATTIEYLLANREGSQNFTAYTSSHDGLPEPLCAIYQEGAAAIVRQFVADGIHCPRRILIRSNTRLLEQPAADALDNVNTPEDLDDSVLKARS